MCKKCGCNTGVCETKIRGPLLTEGKVRPLVSKNLQYHIDNNIPLTENKFLSLNAYLYLIKEARKLYSRNVLDVNKKDKALMKTNVGEFTLHENKIVPLDLPIINEFNIGAIAGGVAASRKKKRDREETAQLLDMAKEMGIDISKYKLTEKAKSNMYNKLTHNG